MAYGHRRAESPPPERRPRDVNDLFLSALALVLVFEGLLPFVNPGAWRRVFERALQLSDGQIRLLGLASLASGVALLLIFGG